MGAGRGPGPANVLGTQRGEWGPGVLLGPALLPTQRPPARPPSLPPPRPTLQASTPPPVPPLVPARCPCGPPHTRGAGRARSACVWLRRRMRAAGGGARAHWRRGGIDARRAGAAGRVAVGQGVAMGQGAAAAPGTG